MGTWGTVDDLPQTSGESPTWWVMIVYHHAPRDTNAWKDNQVHGIECITDDSLGNTTYQI